ncbi:MAG TPA: hypothetical protein VMU22_15905 [Rhizomicrobium sp.]|nr:hypothetical protein [Rhizomicrobium sp.]
MRKLTIFVALMVASLGAAAGPVWGPPGWQNAPLDPSYGPPGPAHPGRFWMVGSWSGSGSQSGTGSSWAMHLTVTEQGPNSYSYAIDYPSLGCGGNWTFNAGNGNTGSFTEHITYGRDKCVDGGMVTVGAMSTPSGAINQMMFRWQGTQPNGSTDYAQGSLTRS